MEKKPPVYVLDFKLKWRTFKELQDKLVRDSGPVPMHGDKVIWWMLRDKQILCWFDPLIENDMMMGFKLPKKRKRIILSNP